MISLNRADPATCGPKAARLGVLLRAGIPVPDGFVVPAEARDAERGPDAAALARELARLGDPSVAVRSSAAGEDSKGASAAGQYASVLAVHGVAAVAEAIRTCWASLHDPRVLAYRRGTLQDGSGLGMAVLVQKLVDADVSGVMFTHTDGTTEIEASWGLGPSVAEGAVTPDAFHVRPDGSTERHLGRKSSRLDRQGTALVRSDVGERDQGRACLDDADIGKLATLAQRVAAVAGAAQDIEWALADGYIWILQARPVTAALPSRTAGRGPAATRPSSVLLGTPGSVGVATGPARIVRGPADFAQVRTGDVIVCPFTDPAWTALLGVAAGVVTERGGVLSHAAIVARERRIPAVLGVHDATTSLQNGSTVTVDGAAGTVTMQSDR